MTKDNDRGPPDPKRLEAAMRAADRVNAHQAETEAYLTRLVPPTNLPQKFLNQLMMAAAIDGNYHTVETLLDNGADPHWLNDVSLIRAASAGHTDIVGLLHRSGSPIDAQDNMAIRCAEGNGHAGTVRYLRECGADPDAPARPSQRAGAASAPVRRKTQGAADEDERASALEHPRQPGRADRAQPPSLQDDFPAAALHETGQPAREGSPALTRARTLRDDLRRQEHAHGRSRIPDMDRER